MLFVLKSLWFLSGYVSGEACLSSSGSEWSWFLPTYEACLLETMALTQESHFIGHLGGLKLPKTADNWSVSNIIKLTFFSDCDEHCFHSIGFLAPLVIYIIGQWHHWFYALQKNQCWLWAWKNLVLLRCVILIKTVATSINSKISCFSANEQQNKPHKLVLFSLRIEWQDPKKSQLYLDQHWKRIRRL